MKPDDKAEFEKPQNAVRGSGRDWKVLVVTPEARKMSDRGWQPSDQAEANAGQGSTELEKEKLSKSCKLVQLNKAGWTSAATKSHQSHPTQPREPGLFSDISKYTENLNAWLHSTQILQFIFCHICNCFLVHFKVRGVN